MLLDRLLFLRPCFVVGRIQGIRRILVGSLGSKGLRVGWMGREVVLGIQ